MVATVKRGLEGSRVAVTCPLAELSSMMRRPRAVRHMLEILSCVRVFSSGLAYEVCGSDDGCEVGFLEKCRFS
jgi:hypothetical protein